MKVDLEAPDRTRKRDREECSSGNDKESRNTDPVHIKKHKISARYSWSLRLVHWLLARSYLAHIVCLFLLLGERADRDVNPPINPAFIYAQVLTLIYFCFFLDRDS
ncbi:unnamed protein product [Protopolystoma xenopodis]|uniref:Uncharacterized protein n=1 Tax=Protopolystoma xenopodis TaxID=117903 RepID=A0A3S5C681_9PLAT|nr:unnamed protein product [Protopolystoma xenopodis]